MLNLKIENNVLIKCDSDEEIIVINDNIISVGELAFANLNAKIIKLPDTLLKINDFAFEGCHFLEEIKIPKNVNYIGMGILSDCPKLKKVIIDEENEYFSSFNGSNVIASIDEGFSNEDTVIEVIAGCQNSKIPEGTTSIGYRAFFKQHYLESIEFPNSLLSISNEAFYDCTNLQKISIPAKTESIYLDSFVHCCSLNEIEINPNNKIYSDGGVNAIIDKNANLLVLASLNTKTFNTTRIGDFAFSGLNVEEVIIPEGVVETPPNIFEKCQKLKYVSLPSTIKTIILPFDKQSTLTIHYNGTIAQWELVKSRCMTYGNNLNYDVTCLDGVTKFE